MIVDKIPLLYMCLVTDCTLYIVHGGQKIESAKKLMQVGVGVKCMHTKFAGRGLFSFGDIACLQIRPNFPFRP